MRRKILAIPLLVLTTVFALGAGMMSGGSPSEIPQGVGLDGVQCTKITRADGSIEDLGCHHNVLTTTGANAIRDLVGGGSAGPDFNYIGLGNDTGAPVAGDTALEKEWNACGVTRATGTYAAYASAKWSMAKTFTSTCDGVVVNASGMFNGSSAQTLLCAANFTQATLQTDDQITVTWNFTVS